MNKINIAEFVAYAERAIEGRYSTRSTEDRAVLAYMAELVDTMRNHSAEVVTAQDVERICLNGANNWQHYSFSGCSLCYNDQIAELILPPSRRNRYGSEWLLARQGDLLSMASLRLKRLFNEYKRSMNA